MSCTDCDEISGIVIPTGPAGDDGAQGGYGGFSSMWLFDTNTGSAPGSTFLRLNNATFASVTTIYVNETNGDSTNLATFLASFGTEGSIRIFKKSDSNAFWMGTLTNAVDSGSYYTLTVTHVSSNGSFAASDPLVLTFTSEGDDGINGTTVLYNGMSSTNITNNSPSYTQADSYTISAAALANNGDVIKIVHNWTKIASSLRPAPINKVKLTYTPNGDPVVTVYDYSIAPNFISGSIITEINRLTSSTALVNIWSYNVDGIGIVNPGMGSISRSFTIDWTDTVLLSAEYLNDTAGTAIAHQQLKVELCKI